MNQIITEENLLNITRTGASFFLTYYRVFPKFIYYNEIGGQELELWYDKKSEEFKVFFEDAFISITRTFNPLLKKAEQIIQEYDLVLKTIINSENCEPLILINDESESIYIDPVKIDAFSLPTDKIYFTNQKIE